MNQFRIVILTAALLLISVFANATVRNALRIKVLDSETHALITTDNGVPKNCDPTNYDAYCNSTRTAEVTNTLLVQEDDRPPYRITCSNVSKWSRCVPLVKGDSYEAHKEKRGLLVYYVDDSGKMRKQLYVYVSETRKGEIAEPAPAVAPEAVSPLPENAGKVGESVKCSFHSSPEGADITVDGEYVGSTPSEISMSTGEHEIVVSMPGFVQWKRKLSVSDGSELTVNAVLEKTK